MIAVAAIAAMAAVFWSATADAAPPADAARGTLIPFRPEIAADFAEAARLAGHGDFREALIKYDALMQEDAGALCPAEPGRFVAVTEEVQRAIGRLPAAGLRMYREQVDAEAARLLELGRAGDTEALLAAAELYRHSTSGPAAMELAAERLFDRTEFARAARLWERRLAADPAPEPARRTLMLVKLTLAHLYGGRPDAAEGVAKRLARELPEARVTAGGRRVSAAEFAAACVRAPEAVALRRPAAGRRGDRPMWSAEPDAAEADVVLQCRWVARPEADVAAEGTAAEAAAFGAQPERPIPAVSADTVFVRTAGSLRALDIAGGRVKWDRTSFVERPGAGAPPGYRRFAGDRGRLSVTVAAGRVFAVGMFPAYWVRAGDGPPQGGELPEQFGSVLTACSAETGAVLWSLGAGKPRPAGVAEGDEFDQLLAAGNWLTAPTYDAGRLYAVVEAADGFHAVCVEAGDGRPVWSRFLGARRRAPANQSAPPTPGSPPAVAGGIACFLTNAGTAAALDAHSGRALWMLQYGGAEAPALPSGSPGRRSGVEPPNPVLIADGRVMMLPADSDRLLALDAYDGRILWSAPRSEFRWLAGAPGGGVLAAGTELAVLRPADGAAVWRAQPAEGAAGRPAVSQRVAFVPVEGGRIARYDLASGRTDGPAGRAGGADGAAPNGNLVLAGGRLVACSESAAAAFFDFRTGYEHASRQIAADPDNPQWHLHRGEIALRAGGGTKARLDDARRDFQTARDLAARRGMARAAADAAAGLHDWGVAVAEAEPDPQVRVSLLRSAEASAPDWTRRAQTGFRLACALEEAGDPVAAADAAQELALRFPTIPIDDSVRREPPGRADDGADPGAPLRRLQPARAAAGDFIGRLIARYGRGCYVHQDAAADALYRKAAAGRSIDGLERLVADYAWSAKADRARLQLGVLCRDAARKASADPSRLDAGAQFARALLHLETLATGAPYRRSPLRASAVAGLVAISWECGDRTQAREWLAELCRTESSSAVQWPDFAGMRAGEVTAAAARALNPGGGRGTAGVPAAPTDLRLPLAKLRTLAGADPAGGPDWGGPGSRFLTGDDGSPLVVGDCVFLLTRNGLCCARPADGELLWRSDAGRTRDEPNTKVFTSAVGALVGDRLVFWDGRFAVSLYADSGRIASRRELRLPAAAAFRGGLLAFYDSEPGYAREPGSAARPRRLGVFDLAANRFLPAVDFGAEVSAGITAECRPAFGDPGVATLEPAGLTLRDPRSGRVLLRDPDGLYPSSVCGGLGMVLTTGVFASDGVTAYGPGGRRLWRNADAEVSDGPAEVPATAPAGVFVSVRSQKLTETRLRCLAPADGRKLWERSFSGFADPLSAALAPGRLYVASSGGNGLTCLNAADGTVVWSRPFANRTPPVQPTPKPGMPPAPVAPVGRVTLTATQVSVSAHDGDKTLLYVFDRRTGRPLADGVELAAGAVAGALRFPVRVGEHLLVETPNGVEVWGAKPKQ